MRPVITSSKHYVQASLATITAGAVLVEDIIITQEPNVINAANECREGAVVKAIYIERWIRTGDTAPGSFVAIVVKNPGNSPDPTAGNMGALHDFANKKNILYTTQGLSNDQDADATPFLRNWIKIPKGKQRFGAGDKLQLVIFAQALDQIVCGFTTYKEYF